MTKSEKVASLSRDQVQKLLENHGYGVYASEKLKDLRKAVLEDVRSGEIKEDELDALLA